MNRKLFALMTQLTQRQEAFARAYAEVKPEEHIAQVLADLK